MSRTRLPRILRRSENLEFDFDVGGHSYAVRTRSCPLCDDWDDGMCYSFATHLLVEHEVQDLPGFKPLQEESDD